MVVTWKIIVDALQHTLRFYFILAVGLHDWFLSYLTVRVQASINERRLDQRAL